MPELSEDKITKRELLEEYMRRKAGKDFETFFRISAPNDNYQYGVHTLAMLHRLDCVTKDLEEGKCSYLCICVPPRHGKSDIVSRRWPVWHLGRNPDHEFILAAYNDSLATDLSYDARASFEQDGHYVFNQRLDPNRHSINRWRVNGKKGIMFAVGIGGTITGRGGNIIAIDDYLKNREEAESPTVRDKVWDGFVTDLWTRRAPIHAVVVTANRWHEDDLVGRLQRANDPNSKDYNPDIPKFEMLKFPAQDEKGNWLFTDRFDDKWYASLKAALGSYGWNALGLQDPVPRQGNMLMAGNVKILSADEFDQMTHDVKWTRGWDLASTKKERAKNDPDNSSGTKAGAKDGCIFVHEEVGGQWTAEVRNEIIKRKAEQDGPRVKVVIETIGGYKDTYILVKQALRGLAKVTNFTPVHDKVARATFLESYFELGNVYLREGAWIGPWVEEFLAFPSAKHDDRVDSLVTALHDNVVKPHARLHK